MNAKGTNLGRSILAAVPRLPCLARPPARLHLLLFLLLRLLVILVFVLTLDGGRLGLAEGADQAGGHVPVVAAAAKHLTRMG